MDARRLRPLRSRVNSIIFLALAGSAALFFFWNLGAAPLEDYDEATYADVALHTVQAVGRPWFSFFRYQLSDGQVAQAVPWIDKPPLVIWLMAGSMAVFGANEFAVRLPSALFGLLTVILTFFLGKSVTKNTAEGLVAAALLLFNASYLSVSREGRLDAPVTLFLLLSFLFFWRMMERISWSLVVGFWVSIGLGVLAKSAVGLLPLPLLGLYGLLFARRELWALLAPRRLLLGLGVFMTLVLPWHMAMALTYGKSFVANYLLYNSLSRFGEHALGAGGRHWWYYADVLLREQRPLVVIFALTFLAAVIIFSRPGVRRNITASPDFRRLAFFGLPAAGLFFIFSLASTKLTPYLTPFFPFFSLFIAGGVFLLWSALRLASARAHAIGRIMLVLVLVGSLGFMFRDTIFFGWKLAERPTDARVNLLEALVDEKAIGRLIAGSGAPVYLYLWTRAESLVFYSQRPVQFLPKTAEVQIRAPSFLVVPTMLLGGTAPGGGRTVYQGKTLTLVAFYEKD